MRDDIAGTVVGAGGPEAGVWVVAETRDLPTRYIKIVATDDRGRYLLPDLPKANYDIWVRGYGLVNSPKTKAAPGKALDLKAVRAPNEAAAAEYYPAIYWWSMLKIPEAKTFPGTGPSGNGIPVALRDQGLWLRYLKTDGCNACHQLGDKSTRDAARIDRPFRQFCRRLGTPHPIGTSGRADDAEHRRSGAGVSRSRNFGDWTDRIAKGELPFAKPPRPTGVERNIVLTLWDWSTPTSDMRDEVFDRSAQSDAEPEGHHLRLTGIELGLCRVAQSEQTHEVGLIKTEWRDAKTPTTKAAPIYAPSPYWGTESVWDSHSINHNPMMDEKNRVWLTSRIRADANPDFCKAGSKHPSAVFPVNTSRRQLQMYDPATKKIETFSTCYTTHHLNFDGDGKIWFSSGSPNDQVVGWFDTKKWDETHDEQASQGWAPFIIDVNGDGKVGPYVEPNQPVDPAKDKRVLQGLYSVSANPTDGTIWAVCVGLPRNGDALRSQDEADRDVRSAVERSEESELRLQPAGRRASRRTACCGRCSRAAILRASTAVYAKARSPVRSQRPARPVRRAGSSTRSPARNSKAWP